MGGCAHTCQKQDWLTSARFICDDERSNLKMAFILISKCRLLHNARMNIFFTFFDQKPALFYVLIFLLYELLFCNYVFSVIFF